MEIEKEVKKMTLGHEIGAGAACLKCKEKCEGFELHFWRKICRNCKCGIEDHDVQLQSEENQKVGRLFEDTKYTGLIAKLKRDGVPTYRGNQVTISIATPAVGTAVPVPAAVTAAVLVPGIAATPGAPSGPAHEPPSGHAHSPPSATAHGASFVPAPGAHSGPTPGAPAAHAPGAGTAPAIPAVMPARKDVVKAITYEWAPPGVNPSLALRYMELLPPERRPIAGTQGADYRKKQMAKQLPEHDQDPERCHELSPAEVQQMEQYVRKYKDEALGVGDLTLPEEMAAAAGPAGVKGLQSPGAGAKPVSGAPGARTGPASGDQAVAAVGRAGMPDAPGAGNSSPAGSYMCHHCQQEMRRGEPAVYAERAGYDKLWHPACFVCCACKELLVDMIYFWKKGQLYCGRHYGDSEKPRCGGCDELIFSNEYTQAEGQNWHLKHFCCFDCDCILAGETYVMEKDKPICKPCYMKNHAVHCTACQGPIEPEAQRVSYGEHHWHAEPNCFRCSGCSKCLMGQRFMALQGKLLCSVECKKKFMTS
ncbi:testin isoform X1 [Electrophorus electricus]|uniref:Testin n=1 Tax=Electrophorus electricus TaxID=8005 RepID=A0A4W4EUM4_ELEEL|nr:testin isoform X1 [Electrophorus electricus]